MKKAPAPQKRATQEQRLHTKKIMVLAMGGKCTICSYSKCIQALDFHHINPEEKDFQFNRLKMTEKTWPKIVEELKKCVMLCSNCHREVHAGAIQIKKPYTKFDPKYEHFENTKLKEFLDNCPVCNKEKFVYNKTCSLSCASQYNKGQIDWSTVDLKSLVDNGLSIYQIADLFNVSTGTISKHVAKFKKTKEIA